MKIIEPNRHNNTPKLEVMGQYDFSDSDFMTKKVNKYASLIGSFLISFSEMESVVDIAIAESLIDDSHEIGYNIIKNLNFFAKIELLNDLNQPMICSLMKKKEQRTKQFKKIIEELKDLATFRNKVAHAKWHTLDKDGYIRTAIVTDKNSGLIAFKKFKITPLNIKEKILKIKSVYQKLPDFMQDLYNG